MSSRSTPRHPDPPEPTATLAAQSGVTVFRVAFAGWIAPGSTRTFIELERDAFRELSAVAGFALGDGIV